MPSSSVLETAGAPARANVKNVKRRAGRACATCHRRKVRCDLLTSGVPCTNCRIDGEACQLRPRQKKRTGRTVAGNSNAKHPEDGAGAVLESTSAQFLNEQEGFSNGSGTSGPIAEAAHVSQPQYNTLASSLNRASITSPSSVRTYIGRGAYLAPGAHEDEDETLCDSIPNVFDQTSAEIIRLQKAHELPPRVVLDVLSESYCKYCHPWMPVLDKAKFDGIQSNESPLLLQAVLMAGSRLTSVPITYASSQEFYARAKTLFWLGAERDPVTALMAACILQWWMPHGPEYFSLDTAYSWVRLSITIAFQIGLHQDGKTRVPPSLQRRIWWSLVARDCCISVAHGRPRAINHRDCNVSLPVISDFAECGVKPTCFIQYVSICIILGDIAEEYLRKASNHSKQYSLESQLCSWITDLPEELKLYANRPTRRLNPYNFEIRQLHVIYLAALVIMNHPRDHNDPPKTVAILASSLIVGIFDEFLIRDEIRYLGPVFTFHLLAASLTQLRCHYFEELRKSASANLEIVCRAQTELGKKWPSAAGSQRVYSKIRDRIMGQKITPCSFEGKISNKSRVLLKDYGEELSNQWDLFLDSLVNEDNNFDPRSDQIYENQARTSVLRNGSLCLDESFSLEVPLNRPTDLDQQAFSFMDSDLEQYQSMISDDMGNWLVWDEIS